MAEQGDSVNIKSLVKKRASIKKRVTAFKRFVESLEKSEADNLERTVIINLKQRVSNIEQIINEFNKIQDDIELIVDDDDEQLTQRVDFENNSYSVLAKAKFILENNNSSSTGSDSHSMHSDNTNKSIDSNKSTRSKKSEKTDSSNVRLPEIHLPRFDGTYNKWLEFRDLFESLVGNNKRISNIRKFHYLRAALHGTASQVIESLEFSSDNYPLAWDTLCERFNDQSVLIDHHIKSIFDLENIINVNSAKIRDLYEKLSKHLTILKQLNEPVEHWDTLIIYIVSSKLDRSSTQEWEKDKSYRRVATLQHFKEFLKRRANLLEKIEMKFINNNDRKRIDNRISIPNKPKFEHNQKSKGFLSQTDDCSKKVSVDKKFNYSCFHCKGSHSLFNCHQFLQLAVKDRIKQVQALKLCYNCLRKNHTCNSCKSSGCKLCNGRHNTILHENIIEKGDETNSSNNENDSSEIVTTNCAVATSNSAVLSTAQVKVANASNGKSSTIKALLDCGSQSSFITTELCDKLNLTKTKVNLMVSGITDKTINSMYKCTIQVKSIHNNFTFPLSCFVLNKITSDVPDTHIDSSQIHIPMDLKLADPNFDTPQPIHLLIGAEMFWNLLIIGRIQNNNTNCIFQNTKLGWLVAGTLTPSIKTKCNVSTITEHRDIQNQIERFWNIEEITNRKALSSEEVACKEHFINNLSVATDNRYVVSLPLKSPINQLGDSRKTAVKRFLALEKRLALNDNMKKLYVDFMDEYEALGHMTLNSDENDQINYYMPHHGVLREASISTKLRVVFNASSPSNTGVSLNDLQMTGPTIQQELFSILLRFRMKNIILSSDISKMYRQVLINPDQRSLQKIIWRANPDSPLQTYQLNTVTYGTTAASFLAIRCLFQVADECEKKFPKIAKIIRNDMYVDDLLTGVDSIEEADYVTKNISQILSYRGFDLRKWKSNDRNAIENMKTDNSSNTITFSDHKEKVGKTLGLLWNCENDQLSYDINENIYSRELPINTKRLLLSKISTIFDPLGLVSPCVIMAKVLMQKLWSENLKWDDSLPDHIQQKWSSLAEDLTYLNQLKISRQVINRNSVSLTLHGFADACESSYGACVYIVSEDSQGNISSNLLCAKTKVAPLKTLTIPRLELCAALILSQLISKICQSIEHKWSDIYCWSDSTIVLGWLKMSPHVLQTFVGNRVAEISRLNQTAKWQHVSTNENPADIVSRGMRPNQLIHCKLWFNGPSWLCQPSQWITAKSKHDGVLPELRKVCIIPIKEKFRFPIEKYSNISRLKRSFAFFLRFIKNCRLKPDNRMLGPLSTEEIENSFNKLLKFSQMEAFPVCYNNLKKHKVVKNDSSILSLHPFMDDNDLIRVGGRIENSHFAFSKKHPVLLSTKHHLTKLIFESAHRELLHAGPQLLLSHLREKYWPIAARNFARKIVHDCVRCCRYRSRSFQPIMGNLPEVRLCSSPPFSRVGLDYAGPFLMKDRRGRGCKTLKCWVCLFVCMVTHAIHLEIVLSLSAEDFLQSFYRFVSRRGKPFEVFSDNGTNFVKAQRELKEIYDFIRQKQSEIAMTLANDGIKWHFIPVYSPHFGGIWEAGVKSFKFHLRRVIGNNSIYFFDFQSLIIRIESILNSRPLTPISSDPTDLNPLTPAHFLISRAMNSIPERPLSEKPAPLQNYQLLQVLHEEFWRRWSTEYIHNLQLRCRWQRNSSPPEIGQMVLVKDDNLPPCQWKIARIIKLIHGKDNVPRVASVQTQNGVLSRALVRLCPLPIVSQSFQGRGHVTADNAKTLLSVVLN